MRRFVWVLSLLTAVGFLMGAAGMATAQVARATGEQDGERLFDFDGEEIEGEILKPDESLIEAGVRSDRGSLIKIRLDFIDEIVRSADEL